MAIALPELYILPRLWKTVFSYFLAFSFNTKKLHGHPNTCFKYSRCFRRMISIYSSFLINIILTQNYMNINLLTDSTAPLMWICSFFEPYGIFSWRFHLHQKRSSRVEQACQEPKWLCSWRVNLCALTNWGLVILDLHHTLRHVPYE